MAKLRIKPTLDSMLAIMNEQDARPLSRDDFPENIFQLLLSDRAKLDKVNRLINEASGFYLAVELVKSGKYRFQLNPNAPPAELPGMLLSSELVNYYKQGVKPASFGEGLRTFFGLVLSIFPFEHKLVLLDEPELHLHPPLVRRLAQELVREIRSRNGQMIVATHSADFIAGCIEVADEMAMVRLTHSKITSRSTTTIVSKPELEPFITNRVIRNTDALNGIFHSCVVVVEGALDKIAYSEFNRSLQTNRPSKHISDAHFVSAGSCAQVLNVTESVRRTGTPTAAILDFDVLYDGIVWNEEMLSSLGVPQLAAESFVQQIMQVKAALQIKLDGLAKDAVKKALKHEGLSLLAGEGRILAEDLLLKLRAYGVFVLPQGEMETMVANTLLFSRKNLSKDEIVIENGMKKLANNEFQIPADVSNPLTSMWGLLSNVAEWVRKSLE
ncbi:MAG: AAA family ATPase [Candidatus Obscuribacterales bacterium]|nr:AAA family ATPase [Candidatus Obscuribacterales bacterium]